jgi:tetratricopeptide (TPR) repeat protein
MSIIHDALKKAEREREPLAKRLPLSRGVRTARRRWRGSVITGMLVGVTTVGAIGGWLWLQPMGVGLTRGTRVPTSQSSPVKVPGAGDRADRRAVVGEPMPVAQALEVSARSKPDEAPSPAAPLSVAFEAQATAEAAFERARAAESKGRWGEAEQYYRQALALNPALVEARNNLGNLYVQQQRLTAAIDEFQAALAYNPHYAIARNNLGSTYVMIGEEALAVQEFLAALRIEAAYVSPYYNLASLYARRSDVGQAVAFLTKALAIDPTVLSWLQDDPDFDGIRAAPELQRLRTPGHGRR